MEGKSLEAELTHHRAGGDRAQQEGVGRGAGLRCGSADAGGGVMLLGAREGNWSVAGGRGRLLKAQGALRGRPCFRPNGSSADVLDAEIWRSPGFEPSEWELGQLNPPESESLYSHPSASLSFLKWKKAVSSSYGCCTS